MHQHGDSIHAAILHVPQFHQVPQKLHRRSCTLPGRKGSTKKSTRDTKSSSVEERPIDNFSNPGGRTTKEVGTRDQGLSLKYWMDLV